MTLSSEIGRLEDENAELSLRVRTLEQQVAFQAGKLEQLEQINAKLQATVAVRETALAIYHLADKQNALEPMTGLGVPRLIAPERLAELRERDNEPMPKFIQNATAIDKRKPMRAKPEERITA